MEQINHFKNKIVLKIELEGFNQAKEVQKAKLDGQCLIFKQSQLNARHRFVGPTTASMKMISDEDGSEVKTIIQ